MRNFFVPHSTQMDRVAARPFFMVTASMSLEAVLGLALDAVYLDGFRRAWRSSVDAPGAENGCRSIVTRRGASPTRGQLLAFW